MIAYIVRRLFSTIVVMAVVAFVVFSLLYLTPGDPAAIIAGDIATDEDIRRIHARLGLDDPFLVQFGRWVWSLAHGDLGTSIFTNLPVTQLIGQRVEPTLSLTLCTLVVAILVAVPLGVVAAARAGSWLDRGVMSFSVLGFSVPVFVIGFLAQFFLGDFLHRAGDKLQISVESDLELHLVPDIGKQRPRIIVNQFIEYFFIWEFDKPPAWVVGGEILAAKLPQGGVEVADIDYVAGGVGYFDSVAHTKRLAHEDVNPGDEAFHRSLHSQPEDDRTDTKRRDRRVPINKKNRDDNNRDG